jgi:uncharacterized Zn finger protein
METRIFDVEAADAVEPQRLERGVSLLATRVAKGRYRVTGGAEEHWVDLVTQNQPRCDCGDHLWRERVCKHILAALLREGDPEIISAVGTLVRELRVRATAPKRRRRKAAAEPDPQPAG